MVDHLPQCMRPAQKMNTQHNKTDQIQPSYVLACDIKIPKLFPLLKIPTQKNIHIYRHIPGLATVLSVIKSQCFSCKNLARLFQFCKLRFLPNVELEPKKTLACKCSTNSAFSLSLQKSKRLAGSQLGAKEPRFF